MKPFIRITGATIFVLFLLTEITYTQIITNADWIGIGGQPGEGVRGRVNALAVDSSGNIYVGGQFSSAGSVAVNNIARWNGNEWSTLGSGIDGNIIALAFDSSGNLYAGGSFDMAGSVAVNSIAKWNGSEWSALGDGIYGDVAALAFDDSGNIYVGGQFTMAGSLTANNIAKWNGSEWSTLGNGMNGNVYALTIDSTGNLYAGGDFDTAGGVAANNIAKWNGSEWSALGDGVNGGVAALAVDDSGNVYVGGQFTLAGGAAANCIAKWNGSAWSTLGSGMSGGVPISCLYVFAVDGSGNLYAGGMFTSAGGIAANNIARWNGSEWSPMGSGMSYGDPFCYVHGLVLDGSGNLYAGGDFTEAGGIGASRIAKWNGGAWNSLGSSTDNWVLALAADSSGSLYAGGKFTMAGGINANLIAKWNGSVWSPLGNGMSGGDLNVVSLAVDNSGNLYAGGSFTTAGGADANCIAKWDGNTWSPLGNGMSGGGEMSSYVYALAVDSSGNLYAGGMFSTAGETAANNIAKWNGSEWSALGSGMNDGVSALAVDDSGNLYAGGLFSTAGGTSVNYIAKWNGSEWSALGSGMNGMVSALAAEGSDNIYAGGQFDGPASCIAKWDGSEWSPLGSGTEGNVDALAIDGLGNVYAGGEFLLAGGKGATYVAMCRIALAAPQNLVVTDSSSQTITIKWGKNTEIDFMQYRIYQDTIPDPSIKVDSTMGGIADTTKTLTGLVNGTRYYFRVTAVDIAGNESDYSNEVNAAPQEGVNVQEEGQHIPAVFSLAQNFPNPFNPTTTITFTLAENGYVSLKVFDILGREVVTLVNAHLNTGVVHHAILDASKLSTGMYFYRLESGKNVRVKKLMILK